MLIYCQQSSLPGQQENFSETKHEWKGKHYEYSNDHLYGDLCGNAGQLYAEQDPHVAYRHALSGSPVFYRMHRCGRCPGRLLQCQHPADGNHVRLGRWFPPYLSGGRHVRRHHETDSRQLQDCLLWLYPHCRPADQLHRQSHGGVRHRQPAAGRPL